MKNQRLAISFIAFGVITIISILSLLLGFKVIPLPTKLSPSPEIGAYALLAVAVLWSWGLTYFTFTFTKGPAPAKNHRTISLLPLAIYIIPCGGIVASLVCIVIISLFFFIYAWAPLVLGAILLFALGLGLPRGRPKIGRWAQQYRQQDNLALRTATMITAVLFLLGMLVINFVSFWGDALELVWNVFAHSIASLVIWVGVLVRLILAGTVIVDLGHLVTTGHYFSQRHLISYIGYLLIGFGIIYLIIDNQIIYPPFTLAK
jgi:hypothetical protein